MRPGVISLIYLFVVVSATAAVNHPVNHQTDRFDRYLNAIEGYIERSKDYNSLQSKMSYFDSSGIREQLTQFQNLLRMYKSKKRYEAFKPYYEEVKKFEDFISHKRDWGSFRYAKNPKYRKLAEDGEKAYEEFLQTSTWFSTKDSMVNQIRAVVEAIDWPSLNKDRDHLLGGMAKIVEKYHDKEYDLTDMELGVHELRRDARRIFFLDYPVNDLVSQSNARGCPIGKAVQIEERVEPKRYTCEVSACLMDKLSSASSRLSSIKYEGMKYDLNGDPIPQSIVDKAQVILDDLKNSNVFLHLAEQLRGCRSPKDEEAE